VSGQFTDDDVCGSLAVCGDLREASWIAPVLLPLVSGVGSLVPPVFEAYARLLHPAGRADGSPVRWEEVAAWSGGTLHALAQWMPMAYPRRSADAPSSEVPPPFDTPPPDGQLPPATLSALGDLLARYTTTPDSCVVGVWEGWGGWAPPGTTRAPKPELPGRAYWLLRGPLTEIGAIGWRFERRFQQLAPSLLWPAAQSWFVATEVDLDSTYVGGSSQLVEALLADPRLEAWAVSASDGVTAGTDEINGPG
jgi:hypothetical protein